MIWLILKMLLYLLASFVFYVSLVPIFLYLLFSGGYFILSNWFEENKQHKVLLPLLESDKVMKEMIKAVENRVGKIRFSIHYLSNTYAKHGSFIWQAFSRRLLPNKIHISTAGGHIYPVELSEQREILAHELSHIEHHHSQRKKYDCPLAGCMTCLWRELEAEVNGRIFLRQLGGSISNNTKSWQEFFINLWPKCGVCQRHILDNKCPSTAKLRQLFRQVAQDVKYFPN